MGYRIDIPEDIRHYEPTIFWKLSKRSLVILLLDIPFVIIGFLAGKTLLFSEDFPLGIAIIALFAAPLPTIMLFPTADKTPPELIFVRKIYKLFLTPGKRKYKTKLSFASDIRKSKESRKLAYINTLSKKKQKIYKKALKKKKVIPSQDKRLKIYR